MGSSTLGPTPFAQQNKPAPVAAARGCLAQTEQRTGIPLFFHEATYAFSLSCRWRYYGESHVTEMNSQVTEVYSLGFEL